MSDWNSPSSPNPPEYSRIAKRKTPFHAEGKDAASLKSWILFYILSPHRRGSGLCSFPWVALCCVKGKSTLAFSGGRFSQYDYRVKGGTSIAQPLSRDSLEETSSSLSNGHWTKDTTGLCWLCCGTSLPFGHRKKVKPGMRVLV